MGKKSNGKLRRQRHAERVVRKGLDQVDTGVLAYVYATDGSTLRVTQKG
jgi:hypothetical protein